MSEEKKSSMASIARMNTLKPEEMDEAEKQAEDNLSGNEAAEDEDSEGAVEETTAEAAEEAGGKEKMQHYGNEVTAPATPTVDDMFRFMLRHTYISFVGIFGVLISLGAIVLLIIGYGREDTFTTVMLAVVALLFTVFNPISLYFKSKKHAKHASEDASIITYTFSDAGLDMARGKEYAAFEWKAIYKVIEGKTGYFIYLNKNQAFVMPKRNLEGMEASLRSIFTKNLPDKKCRISKEA